jgi:Tfp pilus assembly protein PilO
VDSLKNSITLAVLAVLLVSAGAWFLLISPKQDQAAATRGQVAEQESTNQALATEIQVLAAKAAKLPEKRAALDEVTAKIPTGPDLPTLVRALTAAAAASGVELVSVTPGAPGALALAPRWPRWPPPPLTLPRLTARRPMQPRLRPPLIPRLPWPRPSPQLRPPRPGS